MLHFGKASEFALHSASATPGIASELALLSLCAMVMVNGCWGWSWRFRSEWPLREVGGLHLALPLDELLEFLLVVVTKIVTDGLDKE